MRTSSWGIWSRTIVVEQAATVERALALNHADFADAIVHEVGAAAGRSKTMTFDRRCARLEGVE